MGPLPILEIQEATFRINVENFNAVLDKVPNLPVVLISINGCMREGKSFVHSYFIRYLKNHGQSGWFESTLSDHEMFAWRSGATRETVGINIWSQPFVTKKDGKDVAVLLLDCQGLFDSQTTYAQNAAIYAFSSLLSSVMIYNVKTKIEEDLLQKILLFSNYTDSISSQDPAHQDTKPYFLFLLRDFEFVTEYEYGFHNKDKSPQGDLENPGNYFDKIFTDLSKVHDKNRAVRRAIQKSYKDIGMFLMPHPGQKFFRDSKKNAPEGEFNTLLERFVEHIMLHLVTKRIGNKEMTGTTFKHYVRLWATLCKDAKFPVAETFQEMSTRLQNDMAITVALETFKMKCSEILNANRSGEADDIFQAKYEPSLKDAIETYKTSRTIGDEDMVADYVEKLTTACETHFKENCMALNAKNREIAEMRLSKEEERRRRQEAEEIFKRSESRVNLIQLGKVVLDCSLAVAGKVMEYQKAQQDAEERKRRHEAEQNRISSENYSTWFDKGLKVIETTATVVTAFKKS